MRTRKRAWRRAGLKRQLVADLGVLREVHLRNRVEVDIAEVEKDIAEDWAAAAGIGHAAEGRKDREIGSSGLEVDKDPHEGLGHMLLEAGSVQHHQHDQDPELPQKMRQHSMELAGHHWEASQEDLAAQGCGSS